jgi:streptogrisin C
VPRGLAALPTDAAGLASGLDRALAPMTATGRVRVDMTPRPATYNDCSIDACPAPMRGGARLDMWNTLTDPGDSEFCTNGFNIHGSNGWQYTVTAGHCLESVTHNYTEHNFDWVGYYNPDTYISSSYPYDGAILPYVVTGGVNYAVQWLKNQPTNRVWATNKGNSIWPILGSYTYEQIHTGWVACATGAKSLNTRCGSVVKKDGGIVTNICVHEGDSGGPLYSQVDDKAYGILSNDNFPGDAFPCPAGLLSYFSPLSKLFSSVHAVSGLTFGVNTA